jgi:hypothetical protein
MLATKRLHKPASAAMAHLDELLDEALEETFPASDPIAIAVELNLSEHGTGSGAETRVTQTRTQGIFNS